MKYIESNQLNVVHTFGDMEKHIIKKFLKIKSIQFADIRNYYKADELKKLFTKIFSA